MPGWGLVLSLLAGCAAVPTVPHVPADGLPVDVGCSAAPLVPPVDATRDELRVSRAFGVAGHRGEDWSDFGANGRALGAPVHSVAAGVVVFAGSGDRDGYTGWGNVVIMRHRIPRGAARPDQEVESLYGHLESVTVRPGQKVCASQVVGTIGTGGGRYAAHLHFEIRERLGLGVQAGSGALDGWVDPSEWLASHGVSTMP